MKLWRALLVVVVLALGAYGFAAAERCGAWPSGAPVLSAVSQGVGAFRAGAARKAVALTHPVTVGGYAGLRSSSMAGDPILARATVVESGGQRVAVVSLEVLLLTQPLVASIREGYPFPVLVTATHTHSSVGQFDRRLASQLAALGSFDASVEAALVSAARSAIDDALRALVAVELHVKSFSTASLVRARTGAAVDSRGLEVRFDAGDRPVARWLLLAAHPTLAPRRGDRLDTDWPGAVAAMMESDASVTTVLQTSVGNASTDASPDKTAFATALLDAMRASVALDGCAEPALSVAQVHFPVPHPDGSRVAPPGLQRVVENTLCAAAEQEAEVVMVKLGCLTLLGLPVEPTFATAEALERLTGATRLVALSNGYLGYLEPKEVVLSGEGESKRQWFGPELYERIAAASFLAAMSAGPAPTGGVP